MRRDSGALLPGITWGGADGEEQGGGLPCMGFPGSSSLTPPLPCSSVPGLAMLGTRLPPPAG